MTDNDDLDAFARLFGATPETPIGGLTPPAEEFVPPAGGAPSPDPLGWLLSDAPAAEQVLPTRRSIAAEAARASREAGRRTRIILGSLGGVILILAVVLVVVLVGKNGGAGSAAALEKHDASVPPTATPTASATPTPTPTASATPTSTPAPAPAPSQVRTNSAPAPSAPTLTATVSAQPDCTSGTATTISIAYTTTNAETLNVASSDGSVNTNLTPAASGTISSVLYQCGVSGESYTLTAYSTAEGVPPARTSVTPTPIG